MPDSKDWKIWTFQWEGNPHYYVRLTNGETKWEIEYLLTVADSERFTKLDPTGKYKPMDQTGRFWTEAEAVLAAYIAYETFRGPDDAYPELKRGEQPVGRFKQVDEFVVIRRGGTLRAATEGECEIHQAANIASAKAAGPLVAPRGPFGG